VSDLNSYLSGGAPKYADLTLQRAIKMTGDPDVLQILRKLDGRISTVRQEMEQFRVWCDRADQLYYAETFTTGGADLWPTDPSATTPGRAHVSINSPAAYVDIPAALQAVEPIENMLATDTTPEARSAAAALERIYTAWKNVEDFDLTFHKATTIKGLYGRTAGRVVWDDDDPEGAHPCFEVVEQPRNLFIGYKNDSWDEPEWAAYVMRYEPNALAEEYGVSIESTTFNDASKVLNMPKVVSTPDVYLPARPWINWGDCRIEVWDYWYRLPVYGKGGKITKMETWNVVIGGNAILREPTKYAEYQGDIPYVPLYNTFVPGVPNGRADLMDIEQLIREKFEKVTAGSQMITNAVAGDYWQLVGPESPLRPPQGLRPKRNELVSPGPGNRIETITPFIAQFQLEQYLGRIDREMSVVSGLNDLLLGLAPAQVLSSSKAINALIANYETRLSMRRRLLYQWRKRGWNLVLKVWAKKDKNVAKVVKDGGGTLDIVDPSLSPRDEMETATRAANLVAAKLWSQRRAMDAVGVDDPETEQDMIREESTDATLFPERVELMAQLMSVLSQLNLGAPQGAQQQASGQMANGQADLRKALGGGTAQNTNAQQTPDTMGQTPPVPGADQGAGGPGLPFAQGPEPAAGTTTQQMISGGKTKDRIMTQQNLGRR